MTYRVVDLFCGCGGLSLGLEKAGFNVLAGFDAWDAALSVYKDNLPHDAIHLDLSDEDVTKTAVASYTPDIIAGGPPCQDFSSAGNRDEGNRAQLTISFARVVSALRPKSFIMENVTNASKSVVYPQAEEIFREAGYGITKTVLDASLCGVPQKRKRLFMIGVLGAKDGFLECALKENLSEQPMTVRDYLNDEINIDFYYRHPRSYKRRGVFSIDEPSATIRGVNRPIPQTYVTHANDKADPKLVSLRQLTTMERSRIQTFRADYRWGTNSTAKLEQMIGNAVPPDLAFYVATHLKNYLDEEAIHLKTAA